MVFTKSDPLGSKIFIIHDIPGFKLAVTDIANLFITNGLSILPPKYIQIQTGGLRICIPKEFPEHQKLFRKIVSQNIKMNRYGEEEITIKIPISKVQR
jgi:hypothetical protein